MAASQTAAQLEIVSEDGVTTLTVGLPAGGAANPDFPTLESTLHPGKVRKRRNAAMARMIAIHSRVFLNFMIASSKNSKAEVKSQLL